MEYKKIKNKPEENFQNITKMQPKTETIKAPENPVLANSCKNCPKCHTIKCKQKLGQKKTSEIQNKEPISAEGTE